MRLSEKGNKSEECLHTFYFRVILIFTLLTFWHTDVWIFHKCQFNKSLNFYLDHVATTNSWKITFQKYASLHTYKKAWFTGSLTIWWYFHYLHLRFSYVLIRWINQKWFIGLKYEIKELWGLTANLGEEKHTAKASVTWHRHTIHICFLYEVQHYDDVRNFCSCNILPFPSK